MKLNKSEDKILLSKDTRIGLVVIDDIENAQQIWLDAKDFQKLLKSVNMLVSLGMDKICVTVEKDNPIVIGGERIGIALAPVTPD